MDPDLKRFAQAVRRSVRLSVKAEQRLPPSAAFVPSRDRMAKLEHVTAEGLGDEGEFRAAVRGLVVREAARFCAVGGMTSGSMEGERVSSTYGLVVFSVDDVAMWVTGISWDLRPRRLAVHAWEQVPSDGGRWREFAQAAIEGARKAGAA
jgi:hypothetical protein